MGRRRKKRKVPKLDDLDAAGLSPEEKKLFLDSLEEFDPSQKAPEQGDDGSADSRPPRKKGRGGPAAEESVDLHGMTVEEARNEVSGRLKAILGRGRGRYRVKIITGKGLHSGPGGAVLPREIHHFVATTYASQIVYLDDSPADVTVGGEPVRGHFFVVLEV